MGMEPAGKSRASGAGIGAGARMQARAGMQARAWAADGGNPMGRGWQPFSGAGSPQPHSESLPGAAALASVHSQARGPRGLFLDLPFSFANFFSPLLSFSAALEALGKRGKH